MNCFDLVKCILDEAFDKIEGTEDERFSKIAKRIGELSAGYIDIDNKPDVDYSDPITQFAYIYTYTTAHASYVCRLLEKGDRKGVIPHFWKSAHCKFRRWSGGSDLLGALKFYGASDYSGISIILNCFDKDNDWSYCWSKVLEQARDCSLGEHKCTGISSSFHILDVCDKKAITRIKGFLDSDVYSFSYFLSEVYKSKDEAEAFFDYLFSNIRSGALVLFIDNNSSNHFGWFDALVKGKGYDKIVSGEDTWITSSDEEKRVLNDYTKKLKGRLPKLKGNISFRLLKKK